MQGFLIFKKNSPPAGVDYRKYIYSHNCVEGDLDIELFTIFIYTSQYRLHITVKIV